MTFEEFYSNIDKPFIYGYMSTGKLNNLIGNYKPENIFNTSYYWALNYEIETHQIQFGTFFKFEEHTLEEVKECYEMNSKIPWRKINAEIDKMNGIKKDFE